MDFHQLRYFHAVVRTGSFTRAAEQLGIGQPSLSQQIRALERKIGTPLFERLGRSVRLTAYGEALRLPVETILQQVAISEVPLSNLQKGGRGRMPIGKITTILTYRTAPRPAVFRRGLPNIKL